MKNPWVIIGIIAVVLFGGAYVYSSGVNERNNEGIEIVDYVKGNKDASVILVEYSDLQCPACAAFEPIIEQVLNEYGDSLRFEYKHYPLPIHPYAVQAAVAAEAAGQQGKFFEFKELLFANQAEWSNSPTPTATFRSYAQSLELDMDIFGRHINSSLLKNRVREQLQEGRNLGITGTPTFYLNGEKMTIQTYEDFVAQVAQAIDPSVSFGGSAATATENQVEFGL